MDSESGTSCAFSSLATIRDRPLTPDTVICRSCLLLPLDLNMLVEEGAPQPIRSTSMTNVHQVLELKSQITELMAQRDAAVQELAQVKASAAEGVATTAQVVALRQTVENMQEQEKLLVLGRDQALSERDAALSTIAQLHEQVTEFRRKHDAVAAERDRLLQDREQMMASHKNTV